MTILNSFEKLSKDDYAKLTEKEKNKYKDALFANLLEKGSFYPSTFRIGIVSKKLNINWILFECIFTKRHQKDGTKMGFLSAQKAQELRNKLDVYY